MLVARSGEGVVEALRERSAVTHRQFLALKRFFTPRSVFLHLDAGDCVLALRLLLTDECTNPHPERLVLAAFLFWGAGVTGGFGGTSGYPKMWRIIREAIGAASRVLDPRSTNTVTTTFGSSTGAKPVNQPWVGSSP